MCCLHASDHLTTWHCPHWWWTPNHHTLCFSFWQKLFGKARIICKPGKQWINISSKQHQGTHYFGLLRKPPEWGPCPWNHQPFLIPELVAGPPDTCGFLPTSCIIIVYSVCIYMCCCIYVGLCLIYRKTRGDILDLPEAKGEKSKAPHYLSKTLEAWIAFSFFYLMLE